VTLRSSTGLASASAVAFPPLPPYHRLAVAPHREKIRASIDAERAQRARALADGGLDLLLATLHPRLRWTSPCLEIINSKPDMVVRLAGRGLLIVPQVFARVPVLGPPSAGHVPILFYPIPDELRILALGSGSRRYRGDLAALLGPPAPVPSPPPRTASLPPNWPGGWASPPPPPASIARYSATLAWWSPGATATPSCTP